MRRLLLLAIVGCGDDAPASIDASTDGGGGDGPASCTPGPATNTWETLSQMTSPRHGMGAAVVGGTLYVPGGADKQAFGAVATHDTFTP